MLFAARRPVLVLCAALAALLASACAPPAPLAAPAVTRAAALAQPAWPETSDPSVVRVGRTYYLFGSNSHLRAPVTVTGNIDTPRSLRAKNAETREAMPTKPAWARHDRQLWAPTVTQFGTRWVMFFAADRHNPPQPHNAQCIGRAFAQRPEGPYAPEAKPWHCGLRGTGGALDPQLFTAPDGSRWLHAAFGDTETPLHAIRLDAAANRVGDAVAILGRRHAWEYHFIEQPAMYYDQATNSYLLTYSAGKWFEPRYSTGVARCAGPAGPCVSSPAQVLSSASGRTGTGGLSFFSDTTGATRAVFASFAAGQETTNGGRSAHIMRVATSPRFTLTP